MSSAHSAVKNITPKKIMSQINNKEIDYGQALIDLICKDQVMYRGVTIYRKGKQYFGFNGLKNSLEEVKDEIDNAFIHLRGSLYSRNKLKK
jgi:hypothetical protein